MLRAGLLARLLKPDSQFPLLTTGLGGIPRLLPGVPVVAACGLKFVCKIEAGGPSAGRLAVIGKPRFCRFACVSRGESVALAVDAGETARRLKVLLKDSKRSVSFSFLLPGRAAKADDGELCGCFVSLIRGHDFAHSHHYRQ